MSLEGHGSQSTGRGIEPWAGPLRGQRKGAGAAGGQHEPCRNAGPTARSSTLMESSREYNFPNHCDCYLYAQNHKLGQEGLVTSSTPARGGGFPQEEAEGAGKGGQKIE